MRIGVPSLPGFAATGGRPWSRAAETIVFVHGAGMDHTVWSLPARHFAHAGRAVLAPDLPGHGRSGGAALADIGAMADWLIACLDGLEVARAALVGHSMGALIALEAAARRPERVARLALFGGAPRMPVHPSLLGAARDDPARAHAMIAGWGHGRRGRIGGHPGPGLWARGGTVTLLARAGAGVLAGDLAACNGYDGAAAAAKVRCPTLVVIGAEDRMTPPREGRALVAAIAGARLVEVPRAGHMMVVEDSDATLDALRGFLLT
jgi:pimeloyl-ACP methyl ester carboxylesterase